MTDNKDLKTIQQQLNTPKTETRIILNDWQPEASEVKKSKLSPAARQKIVNHNKPYQSQNQESYGPCYYSDCNRKGEFFDLQIGIEGCKWWATSYKTSLPGYWKPSPTVSYYSKESLWLSNVGDAYNADSLIGQKSLYTVGTLGQYAAENDEFCGGAQNFIRARAREHEQGYTITETITLPSSTTKATKWTVRIAGSVAATTFLGPGGAVVAGAGTWMIGKGAEGLCDNDKAKSIWGTVKDVGGDSFHGGIASGVGAVAGKLGGKGFCEFTSAHKSKTFEFVRGCIDSSAENVIQHNTHIALGRNWDSNCSVCNP